MAVASQDHLKHDLEYEVEDDEADQHERVPLWQVQAAQVDPCNYDVIEQYCYIEVKCFK